MKIEKFTVGYLKTNSYLAYDEETKVAFLVDPSRGFKKIKDFIDDKGLNLTAVLITHGHIDHIEQGKKWQELGVKIYISKFDAEKLNDNELCLASLLYAKLNFYNADVLLEDGQIFDVGNFTITAIHTPGHSTGSLCYLVNDVIFCGDTVFKDSYGRYDFPGGNYYDLKTSIKKLFNLTKDYKLLCGHGEDTTLFYERKNNPILFDVEETF